MHETPMNFKTKITKDVTLVYSDLMELCQGGPEVGDVTIDNVKIQGRYGGPVLFDEKYIYIPVYERSFFSSGFKLARVKKTDKSIQIFGKIKNLIYLSNIEDNKIYFFEDVNRNKKDYYDLG